jgi:NAD(P)-dependent dehydrogenase (short-subunit alcohol dehydrogenase family)
MKNLTEFQNGNLAVITGGASGIGFSAAAHWVKLGMKVALIDHNEKQLDLSKSALAEIGDVFAYGADVSDQSAIADAARHIQSEHGDLSVLFANAGIQPGSKMFGPLEDWKRVIDVNFWGVVNTVNAFAPAMRQAQSASRILITGSKQGISTPPGDPAYNISKSAVKVFAEALSHELRSTPDHKISAHLVIPGFVWTPLTYGGRTEKPTGAWTAEQTVDFIMASLAREDFYILCPDNDVARALDEKRIAWAAGDIIHNRPPLSRWHRDYADAFANYIKEQN